MSNSDVRGTRTAREPLLKKSAKDETVANDGADNATAPVNSDPPIASNAPSAALLGCCTLTIVLIGIASVLFVSFLPLAMHLVMRHILPVSISAWESFLLAGAANLLHLRALWVSAHYLQIMRTLVLPIRRLLLPLVPFVARIESIREGETTQYYRVQRHSSSLNNNVPEFRKSVRRHYKRMQKIYQRHGIRHASVRAESGLVLRDVIPVIWEHQQRSMATNNPVEDFIKRALVVTVVPDGVLDLYYHNNNQLVGVQFSILQGNVWHWFMYFCANGASQSGIWWHGALLAIQRGHALPGVGWCNAHMHQKESKLHAGYTAADPTQRDILAQIYPWRWTSYIPDAALNVRLWDSETFSGSETERESHSG